MVRVAVVGTGRVGGEVAYNLVFERYVTELSLVDIAPKVAEMTKEELCHAIASHGFDVKIDAYEDCKHVNDADLIVVTAGFPRTKEASRRELVTRNGKIVHEIVLNTLDNNNRAWYFVVTNPVDAMTTLANKTARGTRPVIGTGTNLETARLRTILSRELNVPVGLVEAYVGGEHGEAAVPLWSTVRVDGLTLEDFLEKAGKTLDKTKCENYVRDVSREIILTLGGTRHGPAGSFIEIIRGLFLNTGKVLSYSRLSKFKNVSEPVYVTVPARIARSLGPDLWDSLADSERKGIKEAAGIIYGTYQEAMRGI